MSVTTPARHVLDRARAARTVEHLAHLDFVRAVVEASSVGVTQTEIARELGVSQPAVSQLLKAADRSAGVVPAGFSGSSPYEIAQRFAAGHITRERVVDELTRWPYRHWQATDGLDWLTGDPGEWNEQVVPALDQGLIDESIYDEVQDRLDEIG